MHFNMYNINVSDVLWYKGHALRSILVNMVNSDNKLESDDTYKSLKYTKMKLQIMVTFNTTKWATIKLFKHRFQNNVIPGQAPSSHT